MSVNKEGLTALHLASSAGSLSCIQVKFGLTNLLHVDFDTLPLSRQGLSIYLASSEGSLSCIQELLEGEKGRQEMLSLEDRWGRTPLLLATSNGNTEVIVSYEDCDDAIAQSQVVSLLLEKGASIRVCNRHRETPLHFCARYLGWSVWYLLSCW